MRPIFPLLTALAVLAGCKQEAAVPVPGPSATPAAAPAAAKASASASAGKARAVSESSELYEFAYAYPAQAGAIPALRDWFESDLVQRRAQVAASASEGRLEARAGDFPFRAYSGTFEWKVVADLPDWLSLSALVGAYTGGAHPNYWFDQLLWDKRANQRRQPVDLFASRQALSQAIRGPFCREIDRQREQKRGEKVVRASGDMFSECIDPADYAVIFGSANGAIFDRIGVLVPPYEAGPYAEGAYEVTLPVTAALLDAVKPQFRAGFAIGQ